MDKWEILLIALAAFLLLVIVTELDWRMDELGKEIKFIREQMEQQTAKTKSGRSDFDTVPNYDPTDRDTIYSAAGRTVIDTIMDAGKKMEMTRYFIGDSLVSFTSRPIK